MHHFSLRCDEHRRWTLTGPSIRVPAYFSDLACALSFARNEAGAGEADIELWADGFYVFIHQSEGWPHRICARRARHGFAA